MDLIDDILKVTMTVLFAVGVVGCLMVIPLTAYSLIRAVFEKDTPEERVPS